MEKMASPNSVNETPAIKMSKLVELRQDRNLICTNFDGYKLSLEPVPVIRQDFGTAPYRARLNDDQYSLLHTELFSLQNLLQTDPWERNHAYFVNRRGEVVRTCYVEESGRPAPLEVVYRSQEDRGGDAGQQRCLGDYNYSLRLISEKYCVLCDGIRHLELLNTGDRSKIKNQWEKVAKTMIRSGEDERNFMIYDCRLDTIMEQKEISLALGRVHRSKDDGVSHYMHLHWAKWICINKSWKFEILETLEGRGSLYYCAFEPRAESLVLSSNKEFKFRSQNETASPRAADFAERPQLKNNSTEIDGFEWTQTDSEVHITFYVNEGKEGKESDYKIECTSEAISVKCGDEKLLDNALFSTVDKNLTKWTMEDNCLKITLVKETTALAWPLLLADGAGPKESAVNENAGLLPIDQQPIVNLEAPIEDCDFPMGRLEDEVKIERFHLPTKKVTHTVMLGSNPPLFTTSLRPGYPLAIVTRQDVDACLWLQMYNSSQNGGEWHLRHEGNLHAFGYVQASKVQKKFMDCSPDLDYAVICEAKRHIFLYRATYDGSEGLRNRKGPKITLGQQHLIQLDDVGEVLGVATAQRVVTLLTEDCILYIQII